MDDYEDDTNFDNGSSADDDSSNYTFNQNTMGSREGLNNLPTIDSFLNPEEYLYRIKKSMLGFELQDGEYVRITEPWATNRFINLFINGLRSVLTQHSMWSCVTAEEAAYNMMERLKEIIMAGVDMGVQSEHLETIINIFDNAMQLFYGIIIDGKGRENIKQVLTSVYKDMSVQEEKKNLFNLKLLNKKIKV